METQKKEMINKIRISADISSNDNPSNYDYGGMVKIKSGDDVVFEFLLLNNSGLIDTSQIRALTLEVLDIGCLNAPEPRSVKLLASKTLLADEIVALESVDDFKTGKCNVSFAFSAQETIWGNGHKWIVLSGYSVDNSKTTFTQGWIETFAKYSAEDQILPDVQSPFIRKDYADALYLNMEANLADVEDVADARRNLSVYSYEEVRDLLAQSESNAIDAIDAKIDAGIAQDVQKNSTDIATHSANIASLAVAKANRGEFWFNGGFLQNDTLKYSQGNPFSFAFGFRANKSDILGTTTSIYIVNLGFLYLYLPADTKKIAFYSSGVFGGKYISDADNDRLLNGEWHSLVISYDGITLKLTDETGVLLSVSATLPSQSSSSPIKIGSYLIGQMRSIKYFNFDMSADDAPYTIADYISGKDESPLLQGSQPVFNWTNSTSATLESIGVLVEDNRVVLTNTDEVHIYPFAVGAFKKGYTYRIKTSGSLVSSQSMRLICPMSKFKLIRKNIITGEITDASAGASVAYLFLANGNDWETELEFTATEDSTKVNTYLRISAVDTSATNSFTMSAEKIGALLSLEDIKNGVQVLDKSGNANNANISGTVYASKENNPARCVDSASFSWAGTMTTQKFANSDVATPANSKVVAYAKASVGMSASFTCGSNSAVSKELSANTLTEIGSFFNASQGAFKVAPSSATTGKMEVYLTIEKF